MLPKHLTTNSSIDPISTFTLQEMNQYWDSCPSQNLADLFEYEALDVNARIVTYILDQAKLTQLFNSVDKTESINFRIYPAATPNIPYGSIKDKPSFVPIIQLFNTNTPPLDISVNALLPSSVTDSSTLIKISQEKAAKMMKNWKEYFKGNLPQLFESEGRHLDFTTFDDSDSEGIRTVFNSFPSAQRTLFIHLGYELTSKADMPFGFRIILEILANVNESVQFREFYELSNPCPPAC